MQSSGSNERQIKRAQKQAKLDAQTDRVILQTLMQRPDGRRWVWLQLEFAQVFVGNGNLDPQVMAFEKGQRNSGLKLFQDVMAHCPNEFVKMMQENSAARLSSQEEEETDD